MNNTVTPVHWDVLNMSSVDGRWEYLPRPDHISARDAIPCQSCLQLQEGEHTNSTTLACTIIGTLVAVTHMWSFIRGSGTAPEWARLIFVLAGVILFVAECSVAKGCTGMAAARLLLTLVVADVALTLAVSAGRDDEDS